MDNIRIFSKRFLVPARSAYEQTRASWAQKVDSMAAVPPVFQGYFSSLLADGREFPYAVLTPSFEGFIQRAAEKMVVDGGNEIVILEKHGNTHNIHAYPLDRIDLVEVRSVLLDAGITIDGFNPEGLPATTRFRFNAVTETLFTPILRKIRLAGIGSEKISLPSESTKFDNLERQTIKFANYARRSLLGSEQVLQFVWQPEIRERLISFFGKGLYHTIAPAHLCLLTDHELILIREENWRSGDTRYGGIWDFVPLRKIQNLSRERRENGLTALAVQLAGGEVLEALFEVAAEADLNRPLDEYRRLA